jgi:ABC-type branched-subunit amino acid transport system ATPase component
MADEGNKISQQRLILMKISRLKNLYDVEILFDQDRPLTAIMGPNGFGKSTILHALACCYSPPVKSNGEDHKFTDFFPNTPHATWSGTEFNVINRYREGVKEETTSLRVTKATGAWVTNPGSLLEREVYFLGVKTVVPKIETTAKRETITYKTEELNDKTSLDVLAKVGYVLNRTYGKQHQNIAEDDTFIGVELSGVNYSALSMGAGEQRLFHLLKTITTAKNYALILIDEIDLLMHSQALERLLFVVNKYAKSKNLQIVFTTHRENILENNNFMAVRHLYQAPKSPPKTFCFNETKPDAITRLTGKPQRPLFVACEDDVSKKIIERVASQNGLRPFTEISCFGAADNCFTLIAALLLNGDSLVNSIFVIDGDRYETEELKLKRMGLVLTGDHPADIERRKSALSFIRQYAPPQKEPPEKRLHSLISSLSTSGDNEIDEVMHAVKQVVAVNNDHEYIDKTIELLGDTRETGLRRIVSVAAMADGWNAYVAPIAEWFETKVPKIKEHSTHAGS